MYILYLFEAVYISHVLSLGKKGLECSNFSVFTMIGDVALKIRQPLQNNL